jgi:hypothetical protein
VAVEGIKGYKGAENTNDGYPKALLDDVVE